MRSSRLAVRGDPLTRPLFEVTIIRCGFCRTPTGGLDADTAHRLMEDHHRDKHPGTMFGMIRTGGEPARLMRRKR